MSKDYGKKLGQFYARKGKVGKWLYQHGGRNINDLLEDKDGKYVLMADGYGGLVPVYLPSECNEEKSA